MKLIRLHRDFLLRNSRSTCAAVTALDLASLLYHIRQYTRIDPAQRGRALRIKAASHQSPRTSDLQYAARHAPTLSGGLGYHLEIRVIDDRTGNVAGKTWFF